MKAVFVDFEMNPIKREQRQARRICAGEIIEIGAVKLNEQGKEISFYKEYVRPEYTTEMEQEYRSVRKWNHDMENHLFSLNYLIRTQKYLEADVYLETILSELPSEKRTL